MPVFDFSNVSNTEKEAECTYITFPSNEPETTPEMPILILDNQKQKWPHHSCGFFTNPNQRTSFEFQEEESNRRYSSDGFQICKPYKMAGRASY